MRSPWIHETNAYYEPRLLSLVKNFSAVLRYSMALNSRCMTHYCRLYDWARAPCNADNLFQGATASFKYLFSVQSMLKTGEFRKAERVAINKLGFDRAMWHRP